MTSTPAPGVSRAVHYVSYGTPGGEYTSQCRAAMIAEVGAWMPHPEIESSHITTDDGTRYRTRTEVWEPEACALHVSNPTGQFFNTCLHDETTKAGGTWHWPEPTTDQPAAVIPEQSGGA